MVMEQKGLMMEIYVKRLFNYPASIVWDEKRECLLVGDSNNHRIRKIAMED